VPADDPPVAQQRHRVVQRTPDGRGIAIGVADHGVDADNMPGDVLQRPQVVVYKTGLEQQILGRIADERQLGKNHQPGLLRLGAPDELDDLPDISGDVAHGGVDLC
jgi:hypothetical protein